MKRRVQRQLDPCIERMIEHVSVSISDYKKSKQLYLEALKPLDYVLQSDYPSDAAGSYEGG
jgi:hypothetical protein